MRTLISLVAALAFLSTFAPPLQAQERSWTVSVFMDGGGMIPIRTLGKQAGALQERPDEQVISEFDDAVTLGGGIEVELPASQIRFRGTYHTTRSAGVTGRLAFCGDPDNPFVTGGVCREVTADASLHTVGVDVAFVRASRESWLRPVIFLGVAMRKYEIGTVSCPFGPESVYETCNLLEELWVEEGGFSPALRFGLGFDVNLGPVEFRSTFLDNVGRYPGGINGADGHAQNDLTLNAGLAVKVF